MALWKPLKGSRTALDAVAKHDGYIYFCTDDGTLHFDFVDTDGNLQRKQINANQAEALLGYEITTALNASDVEIPTSKAVIDILDERIVQPDWLQTDDTQMNYIQNKPSIATEDDILALLASYNIVTPMMDTTGYTYVDIDQKILTM